ncbi:hypothetical protein HALO98_50170 [Vreelandella titanicae]|nr:hypothetical protein HALO98_50170 [Halomonas titanicae]
MTLSFESVNLIVCHNEAVEKTDFEPFPPPVVLIYLPSRSSG